MRLRVGVKAVLLNVGISAIIICAVLLAKSLWFQPKDSALTLCIPRLPTSALPILADALGYFKTEDMTVALNMEHRGRDCVAQVISGKSNLAVTYLYSAVEAVSNGHQISLISEMHSSIRNTSIVYRRSQGDLVSAQKSWQRIAYLENSNAQTLLRLYFTAHQIGSSTIKFVKVKSITQVAELLEQGKVDAGVLYEPYLYQIQKKNPDIFAAVQSSFYTEFSVLISQADLAKNQPDKIDGLVRALYKAQLYYEKNRLNSQNMILAKLNLSPSDIDPDVWSKIRFGLGMSSVLEEMMGQESLSVSPLRKLDLAETSAINISLSLFPQALRKISMDLVTYE